MQSDEELLSSSPPKYFGDNPLEGYLIRVIVEKCDPWVFIAAMKKFNTTIQSTAIRVGQTTEIVKLFTPRGINTTIDCLYKSLSEKSSLKCAIHFHLVEDRTPYDDVTTVLSELVKLTKQRVFANTHRWWKVCVYLVEELQKQ